MWQGGGRRRARAAQRRQSVGVIKDMRGDRDGLARTPVKVLMVAGHAAFLFKVCVCVIEEIEGGWEGDNSYVCETTTIMCFVFFLRQCKVAV